PTPLAFSFHYSIDPSLSFSFFFFNDTATTEIYTLSLHDALPIWGPGARRSRRGRLGAADARPAAAGRCGLPSRRPVYRRVYRRRTRPPGVLHLQKYRPALLRRHPSREDDDAGARPRARRARAGGAGRSEHGGRARDHEGHRAGGRARDARLRPPELSRPPPGARRHRHVS